MDDEEVEVDVFREFVAIGPKSVSFAFVVFLRADCSVLRKPGPAEAEVPGPSEPEAKGLDLCWGST